MIIVESLLNASIKFAEKPEIIYPKSLRLILTYILPFIVIVNFPSKTLMQIASWKSALYMFLITIFISAFAIWGWNKSIKYYSSASS